MHRDSTPRICQGLSCYNPVTGPKRKRFCSKSCATRFNRSAGKVQRTGENFLCEVCGESFYRYQADITKAAKKGSRILYCSKACENGLKASTNVELTCPQCKTQFVVWASRITENKKQGHRATYCSAKCRDAANGESQKSAVTIPCAACGKSFIRIPALIRQRNFCSRACFSTQVSEWSKQGRGNWGHRDDLGHFVRSSWESNVCRVLLALGIPYEYEPRTFRLPTGRAYRPDLLIDGRFWIEVKGQMTDAAAAKIAVFRATYPDETLVVLGRDDYRTLEAAFGLILPNWEHPWGSWGKHKHAALFAAQEEAHSVA